LPGSIGFWDVARGCPVVRPGSLVQPVIAMATSASQAPCLIRRDTFKLK